jgi:hypothetical protein
MKPSPDLYQQIPPAGSALRLAQSRVALEVRGVAGFRAMTLRSRGHQHRLRKTPANDEDPRFVQPDNRGLSCQFSKIRQVVVPWASKRPLRSVIFPSAVPMRRPLLSTRPSALISPVSVVIGRTREILNSSVV